jgi:hypothetical protein
LKPCNPYLGTLQISKNADFTIQGDGTFSDGIYPYLMISPCAVCEELIRTKSIPARISFSIVESSSVAGPKVVIIFVRLRIVNSLLNFWSSGPGQSKMK